MENVRKGEKGERGRKIDDKLMITIINRNNDNDINNINNDKNDNNNKLPNSLPFSNTLPLFSNSLLSFPFPSYLPS